MTTPSRLEQAYEDLLNQFKGKPNFFNYLSCIWERWTDIDNVHYNILNDRHVEAAEGVWLDINGNIAGLYPRPNKYVEADYIFTLKNDPSDPDDPNKGFATTTAQNDGGYWQSIEGLVYTDQLFEDETYRKYILVKAEYTFKSPSLPTLYKFIRETFDLDCDIVVSRFKRLKITPARSITSEEKYMIEKLAPLAHCETLEIEWVA